MNSGNGLSHDNQGGRKPEHWDIEVGDGTMAQYRRLFSVAVTPTICSTICSALTPLTFHTPLHNTPPSTFFLYIYIALSLAIRTAPAIPQSCRSPPMAPLVPVFSAEKLPEHVNIVTKNFREKRRKGGAVELEKCKLLEMVQYSCNPPQDGIPKPGVVVCKPVVRLFRR